MHRSSHQDGPMLGPCQVDMWGYSLVLGLLVAVKIKIFSDET